MEILSIIFTELNILLFLICWYFTTNDYIQNFLNGLGEFFAGREDKLSHYVAMFIGDILMCFKCLTFFVVLIGTQSLLPALALALMAHYISTKWK